jgi:hypothetical protein
VEDLWVKGIAALPCAFRGNRRSFLPCVPKAIPVPTRNGPGTRPTSAAPSRPRPEPRIFVAASRDGQARARVVADDHGTTLETALAEWLVPQETALMSDGK